MIPSWLLLLAALISNWIPHVESLGEVHHLERRNPLYFGRHDFAAKCHNSHGILSEPAINALFGDNRGVISIAPEEYLECHLQFKTMTNLDTVEFFFEGADSFAQLVSGHVELEAYYLHGDSYIPVDSHYDSGSHQMNCFFGAKSNERGVYTNNIKFEIHNLSPDENHYQLVDGEYLHIIGVHVYGNHVPLHQVNDQQHAVITAISGAAVFDGDSDTDTDSDDDSDSDGDGDKPKKKQLVCFLLTWFLGGYGAGQWYLGLYGIAVTKLLLGLSVCCVPCVIGCQVGGMPENPQETLMQSGGAMCGCCCFCLMFLTWMVWYWVDVILFAMNDYADADGVYPEPW